LLGCITHADFLDLNVLAGELLEVGFFVVEDFDDVAADCTAAEDADVTVSSLAIRKVDAARNAVRPKVG
jgi:hypothetical protein